MWEDRAEQQPVYQWRAEVTGQQQGEQRRCGSQEAETRAAGVGNVLPAFQEVGIKGRQLQVHGHVGKQVCCRAFELPCVCKQQKQSAYQCKQDVQYSAQGHGL